MNYRVKTAISLIFLLLGGKACYSQFEKIDSIIDVRPKIISTKKERIEELKSLYRESKSDHGKLELLDILFDEYQNFSYDSALYYVDKVYRLAEETGDEEYRNNALLNKASLYLQNGDYLKAGDIIKNIEADSLSIDNRKLFYNMAFGWNYHYLKATENKELKRKYSKSLRESIDKKLENDEKNTGEYFFDLAQKLRFIENKQDSALYYYSRSIEKTPVRSLLYANAAYSVALLYKETGDKDLYEEWLIKAAISELQNPSKENIALQDLAMWLYNGNHKDLERATRYFNLSMEDALEFDSRQKITEISEKFSSVLPVYLEIIKNQRINLNIVFAGFFIISLFGFLMYLHSKKGINPLRIENKSLGKSLEGLHSLESRLDATEESLKLTGQRLIETEQKLKTAEDRAKNSAAIWMDIYGACLKRGKSENSKDIQSFFVKFDSAILTMCPDFIEKVNELLKEKDRIITKDSDTLNTELRICGLIKLGVNESSEMADLLFASAQTIYNNRTKLRNKAKDKDGFEDRIRMI